MNVATELAGLQRSAILRLRKDLFPILGVKCPEGLSEEEQLAELLRLALFEKTPLENPLNAFMERLRNGDFNPLRHGEDPNDLPENREPLTDEEYKRRKSRVYAISKYYNGKSSAKVFEVMAEAIMNLE